MATRNSLLVTLQQLGRELCSALQMLSDLALALLFRLQAALDVFAGRSMRCLLPTLRDLRAPLHVHAGHTHCTR
jgi:hypothetical protein